MRKALRKNDKHLNLSFDANMGGKENFEFQSPKQRDMEGERSDQDQTSGSKRTLPTRHKRIYSKQPSKNGDTIHSQGLTIPNPVSQQRDPENEILETMPLILEGLANHKYFADFNTNQQNHTNQFYLSLCQLETNIETVQKPQLKKIFD